MTRVTRKSQVSRSAAPKSERPVVFEWVLEEVKYVAAEGNDRTYIEKDKKKEEKKQLQEKSVRHEVRRCVTLGGVGRRLLSVQH